MNRVIVGDWQPFQFTEDELAELTAILENAGLTPEGRQTLIRRLEEAIAWCCACLAAEDSTPTHRDIRRDLRPLLRARQAGKPVTQKQILRLAERSRHAFEYLTADGPEGIEARIDRLLNAPGGRGRPVAVHLPFLARDVAGELWSAGITPRAWRDWEGRLSTFEQLLSLCCSAAGHPLSDERIHEIAMAAIRSA